MIELAKCVIVKYVDLPKDLKDKIRSDYRFSKDIAIIYDCDLPQYEYLCDYDNALAKAAKEHNCSTDAYESDGDDKFIKALFDLDPDAFIDYEYVIIDCSW